MHTKIILLLFLAHIFLRFYQLESRLIFTYDQLDSAWAAKNILVDHVYPLLGPGNKLGSGIFVGPAYYYLISIVYFFTNLDPIAAGIFAGISSIFNFWVIYFVTKSLFSIQTTIIALFVHTFAISSIIFDRNQWEINFVPSISLLFFYLLYRIITGRKNLIPWLLFVLGASFHVHLTVASYVIVIFLLTIPLWMRTMKAVKSTLLSSPLFFIWLVPIIIGYLQLETQAAGAFGYAASSFHGIHLTRFLQVFSRDLFIENSAFFPTWLKLIVFPLFLTVYYLRNRKHEALILCFLILLWFIIPPSILSLYNGEITIYYHASTRYISLLVGSYLLWEFWRFRYPLSAGVILLYFLYFGHTNVKQFLAMRMVGLRNWRVITLAEIDKGNNIPFKENYPPSYLYWYYAEYLGK